MIEKLPHEDMKLPHEAMHLPYEAMHLPNEVLNLPHYLQFYFWLHFRIIICLQKIAPKVTVYFFLWQWLQKTTHIPTLGLRFNFSIQILTFNWITNTICKIQWIFFLHIVKFAWQNMFKLFFKSFFFPSAYLLPSIFLCRGINTPYFITF